MNIQKFSDYTFSLESSETPKEIFETLLNVRSWWFGLYSETIEGSTNKLNEEFTFSAGGGMHYSKQKLVELIPNKKIVWLVTDSNLTFLEKPNEWTGTKICFDISEQETKTQVRFTHVGLVPEIECYDGCSSAWSQYMQQFLSPLINKVKA
ncbi:MAG: SRPBCC domain-containing protein [Bacteroidia bacterium]